MPETDVPVSAEDQLTAIFARQTGEAKEPEPVEEDTPDEVTDEADSADDDAPDEADSGQSEVEPDAVELTVGQEVKKLTKAELAELVAKRDNLHADYTRKTQEIANQRRAVEDRELYLQAREVVMDRASKEAAQVQAISDQLAQFDSLDWNTIITDDPQRALQLNLARQQLRERLNGAQSALDKAKADADAMLKEHTRRQTELGQAELTRRLGSLDDKTRVKLAEAAKEMGYTAQDMMSPAALHALHLASKYLDLQKAKPLAEKRVAQAKPMTAPAARSGQQSVEQSKREDLKARLRKTGKRDDAEAYLTRLFESKRKR